jgi:hypothetical protein
MCESVCVIISMLTVRLCDVSLFHLRADFLCMLDSKFNSTVSNIFHTVDKLASPTEYTLYTSSTPPPVTPSSHCSLCARPLIAAESAENARTRHAGVGAMHRRADKQENQEMMERIPACYGCEAVVRELDDASLLPSYIRLGVFRDHRPASDAAATEASTAQLSAYPAAWRTLREQGGKMSHGDRAESNRALKAREAASELEDSEATADATASQSLQHQHGELHKQSREDMRASFAEFVLPEE